MRSVRIVPSVVVLLAITGPATAQAASVVAPEMAVAQLNDLRAKVGVRPVAHDTAMSDRCAKHAEYFRQNPGTSGHFEEPGRPGYSAEGHEAAATSNLAYRSDNVFLGAWDWEPALYHRTGMLSPRLARSGYWADHGIACQTVVPRDAPPGVDALTAYPYPYNGQTRVAVDFDCKETPNPCDSVPGASVDRPLGMLLSLQFDAPWDGMRSPDAEIASLREVDTGTPVDVVVEDKDSPRARYLDYGLALLPTRALRFDTEYEAHVSGTAFGWHAGQSVDAPFDATWRFRTIKAEEVTGYSPSLLIFSNRAEGTVTARTNSPAPVKLTLLSGGSVLGETTVETTAEPNGRRQGNGALSMPREGSLSLCGEQQPMSGFAGQRVCMDVPPASSPGVVGPPIFAPVLISVGASKVPAQRAPTLRLPATMRFRSGVATLRCPSSCAARVTVGRRLVARGAGTSAVRLRLTAAGRRLLRNARRPLRATLAVTLGGRELTRTVSVRRS